MSQHECPACDHGVVHNRFAADRPCETCGATGQVTIDAEAIMAAIVATRGAGKGQIRQSGSGMDGTYGAKYVWRMVRFQAGVDTHMPIMAYDTIGVFGLIGPAAREVLDTLEPIVKVAAAVHYPERQHAGTLRWGRALGMVG